MVKPGALAFASLHSALMAHQPGDLTPIIADYLRRYPGDAHKLLDVLETAAAEVATVCQT